MLGNSVRVRDGVLKMQIMSLGYSDWLGGWIIEFRIAGSWYHWTPDGWESSLETTYVWKSKREIFASIKKKYTVYKTNFPVNKIQNSGSYYTKYKIKERKVG